MEVLTTRVAFLLCSRVVQQRVKPFSGITTMEDDESINGSSLTSLLCLFSHALLFFLLCPELLDLQAGAFFLQFCDVASHSDNHPPKGIQSHGVGAGGGGLRKNLNKHTQIICIQLLLCF